MVLRCVPARTKIRAGCARPSAALEVALFWPANAQLQGLLDGGWLLFLRQPCPRRAGHQFSDSYPCCRVVSNCFLRQWFRTHGCQRLQTWSGCITRDAAGVACRKLFSSSLARADLLLKTITVPRFSPRRFPAPVNSSTRRRQPADFSSCYKLPLRKADQPAKPVSSPVNVAVSSMAFGFTARFYDTAARHYAWQSANSLSGLVTCWPDLVSRTRDTFHLLLSQNPHSRQTFIGASRSRRSSFKRIVETLEGAGVS